MVRLTLSSADGVTAIIQDVFDSVNIKWKNTNFNLPAIVLHSAGLNVLLGFS